MNWTGGSWLLGIEYKFPSFYFLQPYTHGRGSKLGWSKHTQLCAFPKPSQWADWVRDDWAMLVGGPRQVYIGWGAPGRESSRASWKLREIPFNSCMSSKICLLSQPAQVQSKVVASSFRGSCITRTDACFASLWPNSYSGRSYLARSAVSQISMAFFNQILRILQRNFPSWNLTFILNSKIKNILNSSSIHYGT